MAEVPHNPVAFPHPGNSNWSVAPELGMTLRDWFAGTVLPAVISMALQEGVTSKSGGALSEADFADQAYAFADAMLTERAKSGATT